MADSVTPLSRWRLVLGRFADPVIGRCLSSQQICMDGALERIYGQNYAKRGIKRRKRSGRGASLDPTQMALVDWLGDLRRLFPQSVQETIQGHALERFEMSDLLNDPDVLSSLKPDVTLLKAIIAFKGRVNPAMAETVRAIAKAIVDDLMKRLKTVLNQALTGARHSNTTALKRPASDFDWRATVRANLKNWNEERQQLVVERLRYRKRGQRRLPWTVILCVDQSGSMMESVIYAAVMASVLAMLPQATVKLVVFDTSVVDLSGDLSDPVTTLMAVQLGGGTNIGQALTYCETLVTTPKQTIVTLISDFFEGAPHAALLSATKRLNEAGVTLLGLAALSDQGQPEYDHTMAQKLADCGMNVAALSPDRFAQWVAEIIR